MPKVTRVGLDIGSSAVRAAEVTSGGGVTEICRFAQVGLPAGAVVEGEVKDQDVVSTAIKRLWSEGGFSRKDVVVGIGSQRAMVRQLEMPVMGGTELKSALRYEIGELLPIPIEQAVYDFSTLGPGKPKDDGSATVQLLAVVAQKDIVWDVINTVRKAGLRPRAVDSSPLAMLRAVAPAEDRGLEAVVSLGSNLVVVAVRQGSVPQFIRTVTIGGDVVAATAEGQVPVGGRTPSRFASRGQAGPDLGPKVDTVVEEIRGSLEFFLSHGEGEQLSVVTVTGGGALGEEMTRRIAATVGVPAQRAKVTPQYEATTLGLTEAQLHEAEMRWATAVGLALWGLDGTTAPSLLPTEIRERSRRNQAMMAAGVVVVVVAGSLALLSHGRSSQVSSTDNQIAAQQSQVGALNAEIAKLQVKALPVQEVKSLDVIGTQALAGDINWVKLYKDIQAALPAGTSISQVTFTDSTGGTSSTATPTSVPPAAGPKVVGTVSLSAVSSRGSSAVATFLRRVEKVPGLNAVWVSSGSSSGTGWEFQMTANITSKALDNRASQLPGPVKP